MSEAQALLYAKATAFKRATDELLNAYELVLQPGARVADMSFESICREIGEFLGGVL